VCGVDAGVCMYVCVCVGGDDGEESTLHEKPVGRVGPD